MGRRRPLTRCCCSNPRFRRIFLQDAPTGVLIGVTLTRSHLAPVDEESGGAQRCGRRAFDPPQACMMRLDPKRDFSWAIPIRRACILRSGRATQGRLPDWQNNLLRSLMLVPSSNATHHRRRANDAQAYEKTDRVSSAHMCIPWCVVSSGINQIHCVEHRGSCRPGQPSRSGSSLAK